MSRVPPLEITVEQRTELGRRLRAHTTTQRALRRARIVLLAADGMPNRQIARTVGIDEKGVAYFEIRQCAKCEQHFPLTADETQADVERTDCPECAPSGQ